MEATKNENGNLLGEPRGLEERCGRLHGWDPSRINRAKLAYRHFMKLKLLQPEDWHATILSPSLIVDKVWHQHIEEY